MQTETTTDELEDERPDPCPGARKLHGLPGWQHPYAVRCEHLDDEGREHGQILHYAWFIGGRHLCGRHRHGSGEL